MLISYRRQYTASDRFDIKETPFTLEFNFSDIDSPCMYAVVLVKMIFNYVAIHKAQWTINA